MSDRNDRIHEVRVIDLTLAVDVLSREEAVHLLHAREPGRRPPNDRTHRYAQGAVEPPPKPTSHLSPEDCISVYGYHDTSVSWFLAVCLRCGTVLE